MRTFLILTVDGVTNGFVYAIIALALVMIWRATRVINYAQGAMGMFTTYATLFAISHGVTYWLAFVIALGGGFLLGAGIERLVVRPVESRPPLNVVILTLGLLILLEALAPMLFGGQVKSFPAPFSRIDLSIGTTQLYISTFDIFVIGAVILTMITLLLFFQRTTIGLRMRAAAFGPEIARLLGVRVGRMLTLGWGLAALLGAMAGVLIAPAIFLYPNNMDEILVFGFTGAVLGGLDSPVGAVVGALLVGLGLSYVGGYAGSDLETIGGLVILIAVLMVRPQGLFAARRQREA
ncbi:MAG: branched-chain amino acid ABC transporter permease [Candidatus Dormibacteria bacterium]|jgi:branched-chain amino acid transport system permease protein